MKRKRILLIGGNFYPEPTGIGKYSGEMMMWLANQGFDCTVLTTYPYYPEWKIEESYKKKAWYYSTEIMEETAKPMKVIRCPHYVPQSPSGMKRIVSEFTFLIAAFFRLIGLLFTKKYDTIITVAPPFAIGYLGMFYRLFRGGRLIYHIQDLQIDAAKELSMIKSNALLKIMFGMERFILKKADYVSSISKGMIARIRQKQEREVTFFPNWADISRFHPITDKASLKTKFGLPADAFALLYSGAIGEKQGLELILEAAQQLKDSHPEIVFLICGSGPYRQKLEQEATRLNVSNVKFLPLQPLETFNDFLNMADAHFVLQKANASDLVMPSKLTSILASGGLSLITTPTDSTLFEQATEHQFAIVAKPEDLPSLIEAIHSAKDTVTTNQYRENARKYAERFLDRNSVMNAFVVDHQIALSTPVSSSVVNK